MGKQQVVKVRDFMAFTTEEIRDGLKTDLDVLFEDNKVVHMSYKYIILQRYLMDMLEVVNYKITSDLNICNFLVNGLFVSSSINKHFEKVIEQISQPVIHKTYDRSGYEVVYAKIYEIFNKIYNELVYNVLDYSNGMTILDLMDIQFKPKLIEAIVNVSKKKDTVSIDHSHSVLNDILVNDKSLSDNPVAIGYQTGGMNKTQLSQVLASRGYTTDLNSTIFKEPVVSSFTLGMKDIYEITAESRSAAKALFLSHTSIRYSEYFARELQLAAMIVERLVDGDCGSTDYLDWFVRPGDIPLLVGKYYLNEDTKQLEIITKQHTHLVDKYIKLRSPLKCKLPNTREVCFKCFGTLAIGIPYHANLGHYCASFISRDISQAVLSVKHRDNSATSNNISLDEVGAKIFYTKDNEYYLKPELFEKYTVSIMVTLKEAFGLKDIKSDLDVSTINPERLSKLKTIIVTLTDKESGQIVLHSNVNIKDGNKLGSFTKEFLKYVSRSEFILDAKDLIVINIDNFNYNQPIILLPKVEYNFISLLSDFKKLFKNSGMTKNSSIPELLLQKSFDLINTKLNVNIAALEVIVYAFTVYNLAEGDYRLGRFSPNVRVSNIRGVVFNRSLGGGYGHEHVINLILSPISFNGKNAIDHPSDVMIKPKEVVENEQR